MSRGQSKGIYAPGPKLWASLTPEQTVSSKAQIMVVLR